MLTCHPEHAPGAGAPNTESFAVSPLAGVHPLTAHLSCSPIRRLRLRAHAGRPELPF